jgi:hypothetical protein
MAEGFREGGWGMYPILIFGLIALGAALRFAIRADPKLRGFVETMGVAVAFFSLSGFLTGLIATGNYVEANKLTGGEAALTVLQGVKESTHNLAFGATLLGLVFMVTAVGRRRVDAAR